MGAGERGRGGQIVATLATDALIIYFVVFRSRFAVNLRGGVGADEDIRAELPLLDDQRQPRHIPLGARAHHHIHRGK